MALCDFVTHIYKLAVMLPHNKRKTILKNNLMDKSNVIKILVEKLENEIKNSLRENANKNPMIGTPLEVMFLMEIINNECKNYKDFLIESQGKIDISDNDIDNIISTAAKNINRQVFDKKKDDDYDYSEELKKFEEENLDDDDYEIYNHEKFIISSLFYKFCFSQEVASLFLNDDEKSKEVTNNMSKATGQNDSTPFILFNSFLKQNNIQIIAIGNATYNYNDFEFEFKVTRHKVENTNNYFEIISNNIENVKNDDDLELAVANNFIVYVENNKPKRLYCVVCDPYVNKYAIRKISSNGISANIGFIENNSINTICRKILETIPKNSTENQNNNVKLSDQFKNYKSGLMSLIEGKNPTTGSDDNKTISYYLGLANKTKAFDFYELVRAKDNGAFFRIHTMNGFKTIVETNSEIVYKDKTSDEWFDLIYETSMKHFFREEYKLFRSGYVKEKSGGCFGVFLVMGLAIFILTATLLK